MPARSRSGWVDPSAEDYSDLQLEQDLPFQRSNWRWQRIAWIVMCLILVAGAGGLFGGGPLSWASAGDRAGPIWVEYERFGRIEAPVQLVIHASPAALQQNELRFSLSREYIDAHEVRDISPPPQHVAVNADRYEYIFAVVDGNAGSSVTFHLLPLRIGKQRATVGSPRAAEVTFGQFVYP